MSRPMPPTSNSTGVLSLPDDAAIQRWLQVPPLDRLRWLAEANEFLYLAQTPEARQAWQAFRRGEL
jgi:hypothetical protein